jgi:hypothetical protein
MLMLMLMLMFGTLLSNRFKDRGMRKHYLKRDMKELKIPPFAYIPLCWSTNPFGTILRSLPSEAHPFTTKARVPTLMLFETEQHQSSDLASFLGHELEGYPEADIVIPGFDVVVKDPDENPLLLEDDENLNNESGMERKPSKFLLLSKKATAWSTEGKGLDRMVQSGIHMEMRRSSVVSEDAMSTTAETATAAQAAAAEPTGVLGETFAGKISRIRSQSPYSHLPGWSLGGLIAKSNDDVRQEVKQLFLLHIKGVPIIK